MSAPKRLVILDTLRGCLLILMVIDHLGGPLGRFCFERLGFWSAAEGFFFLSGFVTTRVAMRKEDSAAWLRERCVKVWSWHMLSVLTFACLSLWFVPLGWKPMRGLEDLSLHPAHLLATLALIHLPDYLDVLPLYVVLLLISSIIIPKLLRMEVRVRTAVILWAGSLCVWLLAQFQCWNWVHSTLPAWMHPGVFDPLGWQFVFFSGATFALLLRSVKLPNSRYAALWLVFPLVFFCWRNGFTPWYEPTDESIWASRHHFGVVRLFSFFSVAWAVILLLRDNAQRLSFAFPTLLGRNSLQVFTWHLPLVYLWINRPKIGSPFLEIFVPILVILSLSIPAWWREKT